MNSAAAPGSGPGWRGADLKPRILSSLVMVPVALGGAWWGGVAFMALVAVGAALVIAEWAAITGERRERIVLGADVALVATTMLAGLGRPVEAIAVVTAGVIFAGLASGSWLVRGFLYAAAPAIALVLLRLSEGEGRAAIMVLFAIVWATDIGAYLGGRAIGGPRLWPAVSPSKTWAGSIIGLSVGVAAGLGVAAAFGHQPGWQIALVAALISVAAQFGDLYESALKRRFGVKDSGTTIPGHGGVMDRVDGLLFAAIVAFVIGAGRFGVLDAGGGLLRW